MTKAQAPQGRPNTVNLARRELDQFLDSLEGATTSQASMKRHFVRWAFRQGSLRLDILQAGGGRTSLRVACRNLSSGGMSVLHSAYMHPRSECEAHLVRPDGTASPVHGTIVRCAHIRGMVHELGIRFCRPINAREFVRGDDIEECFSLERVDPEKLRGTILYADDSPMDVKLVQHYLRGTQVRLRTAADAEAGLAIAREGVDLILCELDLPGTEGAGFLESIRRHGVETPAILVTSDRDAAAKGHSAGSRACALILKPLKQEVLLRAAAEFLLATNPSGGFITSSLPAGHPNAALLGGFIDHVRTDAQRLTTAMEAQDAPGCRAVALRIAGVAPAMGFEQLGRLAQEAASHLATNPTLREAVPRLKALVVACQAVRAAA